MQKIKLVLAALIVSFSLASAPAIAGGPCVKKPPQMEMRSTAPTFSLFDWFSDLFSF